MVESHSVEIDVGRVLLLIGVAAVVGMFVASAAAVQLTEGQETVRVGDINDGKHESVDHIYLYENMSEQDQTLFNSVEDGQNTTVTNPPEESFASQTGTIGVVQQDGSVDRVTVEKPTGAEGGAFLVGVLALGSIIAFGLATEDIRTGVLLALIVLAVSAYVVIV